MIRDVPGIEHLHREFAPFRFVETVELRGIKFIIQQSPFAADEVRVKIIRLQTINHRRAFADPAILEFQNRHARRRIFVG